MASPPCFLVVGNGTAMTLTGFRGAAPLFFIAVFLTAGTSPDGRRRPRWVSLPLVGVVVLGAMPHGPIEPAALPSNQN